MSQYFENDDKIKSEIRKISFKYGNNYYYFYSDNGVFSKDQIDYGTRLLIETFIKSNKKENRELLDVGSGLGVIAIILAKVLNCKATMIEINERAIELSKKNIILNNVNDNIEVIKSNVYENVLQKYDIIITNPPIRAGKKVVYEILLGAKEHLKKQGELWFVMRKNHGALTAKKDVNSVFNNCDIISKDKGFFVLRAINFD